eukprot:3980558-Pleurochrysis_carterae.AAC.1
MRMEPCLRLGGECIGRILSRRQRSAPLDFLELSLGAVVALCPHCGMEPSELGLDLEVAHRRSARKGLGARQRRRLRHRHRERARTQPLLPHAAAAAPPKPQSMPSSR